jgi:diaminopimelate decarboxylase
MTDRLPLFPDSTRVVDDRLTLAGCSLEILAEFYGTPLYLYDRLTLDQSVEAYRAALGKHFPGSSGLTYAGKAFLCLALVDWALQQDLRIDCTGLGELAIAAAAGASVPHLLVHGVNKSAADLQAACEQAGVIVVDNLSELEHLIEIHRSRPLPELWLRFQPGTAVHTHAYTQTGQEDSKFGMGSLSFLQAAQRCREAGLPLKGIHFHQGSQFSDPAPLEAAIEAALDLAMEMHLERDWTLCPGGGWGVAYHEDDLPQPEIDSYVALVARSLVRACKTRHLSLPHLQLEPGRSLVARAGVALYRVGAIKMAADRTWVLLDGGLADNPRPALYRTRYSALPVRGPGRPAVGELSFAGPFCESGDVLIEALPFPDVQAGDLVAVPVSGAYQLSMSSNYNGACKPAVVWLEDGRAHLIQERELPRDLYRRDGRLPNSAGASKIDS